MVFVDQGMYDSCDSFSRNSKDLECSSMLRDQQVEQSRISYSSPSPRTSHVFLSRDIDVESSAPAIAIAELKLFNSIKY